MQRDFLCEIADARQIDSMELQAVANRLPAKDWLSSSDLALALDVAQSTILEYVALGDLKALNIGTADQPRYRFLRETVLKFIKERFSK